MEGGNSPSSLSPDLDQWRQAVGMAWSVSHAVSASYMCAMLLCSLACHIISWTPSPAHFLLASNFLSPLSHLTLWDTHDGCGTPFPFHAFSLFLTYQEEEEEEELCSSISCLPSPACLLASVGKEGHACLLLQRLFLSSPNHFIPSGRVPRWRSFTLALGERREEEKPHLLSIYMLSSSCTVLSYK